MKYFLVYKDGRRVETKFGGGHTIHVPVNKRDGRSWETLFEFSDCSDPAAGTGDKAWIEYKETETIDVTARLAEGRRMLEQHEREWRKAHAKKPTTKIANALRKLADQLERV